MEFHCLGSLSYVLVCVTKWNLLSLVSASIEDSNTWSYEAWTGKITSAIIGDNNTWSWEKTGKCSPSLQLLLKHNLRLRDKKWNLQFLIWASKEDNNAWSQEAKTGIFSLSLHLLMNTTKLEAKRKELEKFRPSFQLQKKTTRLEVKRQSSSLQLL